VDRVTEAAELVDVAAESAAGYFETFRKITAGPVAASLKEREKPQQAGGGFEHDFSLTFD
jgi:hypothetical protein